ncbi:MAG: PQQ-binding-like beta-propeller repeat protein [Candidatus Methanofastidiosa archaeon]|nr:PQQ-binding-like beta-propeller repeat protein [Candidatus Methanofastidiosa archaeon]
MSNKTLLLLIILFLNSQITLVSGSSPELWKQEFQSEIYSFSATPDFSYLAIGTETDVSLFDNKGNLLWEYKDTDKYYRIAMTPDGSYLAINTNRAMYLFNNKGSILSKYIYPAQSEIYSDIAITGNGSSIIVASESGIFSFNQNAELQWQYPHEGYVGDHAHVSLSGDDKYILIALGYQLYYFTIEGELLWKTHSMGYINGAKVSTDGRFIVVGSENGLYCFDIHGKKLWNASTGYVWDISMTPDGSHIVCSSNEGILFFNKKGKNLWADYNKKVASIAPNGEYIAVGSSFELLLCDKKGWPKKRLEQNHSILSIEISSDGTYLTTISEHYSNSFNSITMYDSGLFKDILSEILEPPELEHERKSLIPKIALLVSSLILSLIILLLVILFRPFSKKKSPETLKRNGIVSKDKGSVIVILFYIVTATLSLTSVTVQADLIEYIIYYYFIEILYIYYFLIRLPLAIIIYKRIKIIKMSRKSEHIESKKDNAIYLLINKKIQEFRFDFRLIKDIDNTSYEKKAIKLIEDIDDLDETKVNSRKKLYMHTRMRNYIKVCPKCGSIDISVESYGYMVRDLCNECSYDSIKDNKLVDCLIYFPEIKRCDIGEFRKNYCQKKKKGKGVSTNDI